MERTDYLWSDGYGFIFDDALFPPSTDTFRGTTDRVEPDISDTG